jgi:predicted DNA-binding ribbon-helix-helix protein
MERYMHASSNNVPRPAARTAHSTLVSKNVTIEGHRTSVRLEPAMWNSLIEICHRERASIHMVCSAIARHKPGETSLTAAIRVFIMSYFRAAATEEGHVKSGHGQGSATGAVLILVQSMMDPGSVSYLPSPHVIGKAYAPAGNGTAAPGHDPHRLPTRR